MKNRMNVPQEYEPVLPEKVKNWIADIQKESQSEGQTIWYQCVDNENFWALGGHKSHKQLGALSLEVVLMASDNEGALMVTFEDNRCFTIQDGTMVPSVGN